MASKNLKYVAAPMVNQSDLPFRLLVRNHGATATYTQMYLPEKLLNDQEYFEYHLRDLTGGPPEYAHPVIIQLGGNDVETIVQAGRKLQAYCDGIDLNLGCPQESARDGNFGGYLLGQKNWPCVEGIVSAMAQSFIVPASAKLRLCQPLEKTTELAMRLEAAGVSWITLHPRTVSARRRRQGAANLDLVKELKAHLRVPVISNGNVRGPSDLQKNLQYTGADGLMVGETLLGNPCLFSADATVTDAHERLPDPVDISLEYLAICNLYPGTKLSAIQTHIRHFVEFQCGRRSWYPKFRAALGACTSVDEIERVLNVKVERWRGRPPRLSQKLEDCEDVLTDEDPPRRIQADEDDLPLGLE